ncbi:MAG: glycine betaine/L-proline ABC transporter ATP-binding protein [Spirochaetia bacterium]|nr:glycine betaine/L-proline ABC transporter ATP-binding protein [Spirochaetia bacterium]
MAEDNTTQIVIKNLWKIYGKDTKRVFQKNLRDKSKEEIQNETGCIVGLRDINLEIKKGEFYILMGLSGSGKSTLIRALIRLIRSTKGAIEINGNDITKMNTDQLMKFRRKTYGMVFQSYGLLPHMTVLENAAYGLKIKGVSKEERQKKAQEVLETVGLKGWEDYYPTSLSGGMQQRVGLARALANDPEILLMDEPFSGLDPLIRRQMQDELVELQSRLQKTIIFVTHDLHEALKLGDRIAIMRNGEIVQIGTPEDIVTHPADEYVSEFVQDASPAKVLTAGSIMSEIPVITYAWEGPKTALTLMKRQKKKMGYVVDQKQTFLGIITAKELERLLGQEEKYKTIPPTSIEMVESVHPEAIIEELFSIAPKNHYAIPVVDEKNRLVGRITNDAIFDSISVDGGNNE